jgi:hypothetical protein
LLFNYNQRTDLVRRVLSLKFEQEGRADGRRFVCIFGRWLP